MRGREGGGRDAKSCGHVTELSEWVGGVRRWVWKVAMMVVIRRRRRK